MRCMDPLVITSGDLPKAAIEFSLLTETKEEIGLRNDVALR